MAVARGSQQQVNRLGLMVWLLTHLKEELPTINHGITTFNLNTWRNDELWDYNEWLEEKKRGDTDGNWCGSSACAVGCAMYHPAFQALGLSYKDGTGDTPVCNSGSSWDAVREFFGLTQFEAAMLFSPEQYHDVEDPNLVAERVRQLIDSFKVDSNYTLHTPYAIYETGMPERSITSYDTESF